MAHGPKLGRVTKNVRRFGFPQFRPQLDESDPGTFDPSRRDKSAGMTMKTTSTTTGYGMRRGHHHEDDDDDLGVYALEPPKKRQRSTATMLLDAAFETVIFTGAVALSAYQLITGKGKVPEQSSITSGDDDGLQAENIKTLEDDPMEEKLSLVSFCSFDHRSSPSLQKACMQIWTQEREGGEKRSYRINLRQQQYVSEDHIDIFTYCPTTALLSWAHTHTITGSRHAIYAICFVDAGQSIQNHFNTQTTTPPTTGLFVCVSILIGTCQEHGTMTELGRA